MELKQSHVLSQKLALTQTMRQSLDCLQLSAPELCEYVQDVALSNPLLDVCMPTYYETELPNEDMRSEYEQIGQMRLVDDGMLQLCRFLIIEGIWYSVFLP